MKLVFIKDYIGRETAMKEYKKGDELDCGSAIGLALIELDVAIEVYPPLVESDSEFQKVHKPKRSKIKELDND